MNHADHVRLIASGVTQPGGRWADMGSGDGAFTLALRDLAGPDIEITCVDTNQGSLRQLVRRVESIFPGTALTMLSADMTSQLDLRNLDGIIAANSLHYVDPRRHSTVLRNWRSMLKPEGRLMLVEYDADEGNRWVPHPISFRALGRLATLAGFRSPVLAGSHPSGFMNSIYAAMLVPAPGAEDV